MSLTVTFATLPAAAPPTDSACPGAPGASDASAPPFSRVLADQRRSDAPPSQSKQADAASANATEHTHDPAADADAARSLGKADADGDGDNKDDAEDKDGVLALDPGVSGLPDAPLAALTLEIATQAAAQLRGARARAAQADPPAVGMVGNGAAPRHSVASPQPDAATSRLPTQATAASRPEQDGLTLPPITLADAAPGDPSMRPTPNTPRPLTHRPQATFQIATARPDRQTGKPSTPASEATASARVAPALDLARQATTTSTSSAAPPSAHELSLTGLAPQQPAPHLSTPSIGTSADAPATLWQVAAPLGTPHWGAALGRQLVTLGRNAQDNTQTAELRLDPPELGPLRVTLTVSEGVAHASFASPHASVRQAVEAAMSQLQSALAQSGIALGQANVSDQETPNQFAFAQPSGRTHVPMPSDTPVDTPAPAATLPTHALVDTFA